MIFHRRLFLAFAAYSVLPLTGVALADTTPPALVHAKEQFYTFLRQIAQGEGIGNNQNLVLNSTILPFDIASDTPFYNDELFREYADRTFTGGVEGLQPNAAAFMSERFSSQYRAVMNMVLAKIDQNHPEIQNSLNELRSRQTAATQALNAKLMEFDQQWAQIAAARGLKVDTVDYDMQLAAWLGQIRYADQMQSYTDDLDQVNAQIDAVRRNVYTSAEIAALENYGNLSTAYNVARPWTANVERSYKAQGTPLTELLLADPRKWVRAMFDSSPLVFPVGDLISFLSAGGLRSYDTVHQDYHLDASSSSWTASGGGSFWGWSIGGGGSGSSSMTHSMSKLNSVSISFANISEYLADRSAWFNPGVLQDPAIYKLVKGRPELNKLQYIAVSLILARGTTLVLKFSEAVAASDWSQSSFSAGGGASFLGFSFGANYGHSSSNYSVTTSADGTTVTIKDDDKVTRVLGARVEHFLDPAPQQAPQTLTMLMKSVPALQMEVDSVQSGKESYIDFQKKRIDAAMKAQQK